MASAFLTSLGTRSVPGDSFDVTATFTGSSSYVTGGFEVTPSSFGFNILRKLVLVGFTTIAGAAYQIAIVPTLNDDGTIASAKFALVVGSTGDQVASTTDVSGASWAVVASGV